MKTAYLIVGAIGSGKSSLTDVLLSRPPLQTIEYVGSDVYKRRFFSTHGDDYKRGYRCADELAFERLEQVCRAGKDVMFELCPTNPNKLNTLRQVLRKYCYTVICLFVATERVEINIERCRAREDAGADAVAPAKIRSRYDLTLDRALEMIEMSAKIYFIDNSGAKPTLVAVIVDNTMSILNDGCGWFKAHIQQKLIPTSVLRGE